MENTINLEATIAKTLLELGINPSLKGYRYLKKAVEIAYNDPGALDMVTKRLYPEVAKEYNSVTTDQVERAMRHAIERLFQAVTPDEVQKYFRGQVNMNTGKMTNTQFISLVVERLKYASEWEKVG